MDSVVIADRTIRSGNRPFFIAEAGVNHNGERNMALALVDVAADAGADAVKFQTFVPELLAAPGAQRADYQKRSTGNADGQLAMLRGLMLSEDIWREVASRAADRGLLFLSTPFDVVSADFLDELGVPAFKVPSGELTHHAFLRHLASKGKPLLVSTGMSTLEDVLAAVAVIRTAGEPPLALLHCVSSYPASPADCNLNAMATMRCAFDVPVGWSDHTPGIAISIAAAALGAELIEKHITLDRTLPGPDHAASLEPHELQHLVTAIASVSAALGDGVKQPVAAEREVAAAARRSLHAAHDLAAGHVLDAGDLVALRPGTGISPAHVDHAIGRRLRRPLGALQPLSEEHLS